MNGGIRLGRLFGIDFSLDYSWFIIFALITFGLSFALFPQIIPGLNSTTYITMGLITSILFFASVLIHEILHSVVALRYGLNIEGIRLMLFGGVSQLTEEPHSPKAEFNMAIVGPLSSLVLGGIFLGIFYARNFVNIGPLIAAPAFWLGYINILLGAFNLLPGFPLDGGRVLRSAVWYFTGNLRKATGIAAGFGKALAYLMILGGIIGPFFGNFSLLWFALLGFYLLRAAEQSYQQVVIQEVLEGIKVKEAMTQNPETVNPDINIEEMVKEHFMKHSWISYPVVENEDVKGIISINDIKDVPRRSWYRKKVRDVMQPVTKDVVVSPETSVAKALAKLNSKSEGRILVMDKGILKGILSRVDIGRALHRKLEAQEGQRADDQQSQKSNDQEGTKDDTSRKTA